MKGEARIVGGPVAPGSPASLSLVLTDVTDAVSAGVGA